MAVNNDSKQTETTSQGSRNNQPVKVLLKRLKIQDLVAGNWHLKVTYATGTRTFELSTPTA